jgi:hypothetical protein
MDEFKKYWAYAANRAWNTFSQVTISTIGVGAVGNGLGITSVDWLNLLSVVSLAVLLSLVMSVQGYKRPVA